MASLYFEAVSKSFGPVKAVDNLHLGVNDGEFLVLLGPSGCGKTTLLRMTAGLEEATSGNIRMAGERINEVPPKDRNMAMVFQSYALYPHLTVGQNIGYPLKIRRVPKSEIEQKVHAVARQLGLDPLLARRPKELSGGQRQRVALGRAIIRKPGVFLMDEPLSNLDAQLRVQMRAEIKRLQRDLAVTTMYVTHDQVEAMSMATRIAIFKDGRLHQIDTPEKVFAKPADLFVAGFIGTPPMNFIEGTLTSAGIELQTDGEPYLLRKLHHLPLGPVVVGVRPQDAEFSGLSGLPAKIYVTEPLGDEYHVITDAGKSRLTIRCDTDPGFKPGDEVHIRLDDHKIHLFDAKTGKRIDDEE